MIVKSGENINQILPKIPARQLISGKKLQIQRKGRKDTEDTELRTILCRLRYGKLAVDSQALRSHREIYLSGRDHGTGFTHLKMYSSVTFAPLRPLRYDKYSSERFL